MLESGHQPLPNDQAARLLRKHLQVISVEMRQLDTQDALFHGCWDWHSAVHAHLAMLLGSKALGWDAQVDWLVQRLEVPALDELLEELPKRGDFERPYGRAWLLHLMIAFEQHPEASARRQALQALADDLAAWLEPMELSGPDREYDEPNFVLGALYAWAQHTQNTQDQERWRAKVQAEVEDSPASLGDDNLAPGAFFSKWSMQALAIKRTLGLEALKDWIERHQMQPQKPVKIFHSVHHMGIHASRAWGLFAAYQATQDSAWLEQARAHIQAADALHEAWLSDRHAYSHWLPQFTVFAVLGGFDLRV